MSHKIHTKDRTDFLKNKVYLDGLVFHRNLENCKVEIRIAINYLFDDGTSVKHIVDSLKD